MKALNPRGAGASPCGYSVFFLSFAVFLAFKKKYGFLYVFIFLIGKKAILKERFFNGFCFFF